MVDVPQIRERVSCAEFLTKSQGGMYCCPICGSGTHKNGTGAVKLYADTHKWFCHACETGGDVLDLYMAVNGVDFATAAEALSQMAAIPTPSVERKNNGAVDDGELGWSDTIGGGGRDTTSDAATDTQNCAHSVETRARQDNTPPQANAPHRANFAAYYARCRERLHDPAAVSFLSARGISVATVEAYNEQQEKTGGGLFIGYDPEADPANVPGAEDGARKYHPAPRLIFPSSEAAYMGRSIDPSTEPSYRKSNSKGGSPGIFNAAALYTHNAQEVIVCEGVFDALSVLECGGVAVALNSTSNGKLLVRQMQERRTAARLIICFDHDPDPATQAKTDAAAERLKAELCALGIACETLDIADDLPAGGKDLNDIAVQSPERLSLLIGRTAMTDVEAFIAEVQTRKYEPIPTGVKDIDAVIGGGFIRQQLVLLGAAPGAGKTALAQWIFEGMAERGEAACLYINLEMSREQMLARSVARVAARAGVKGITPTVVLQGYKWTDAQRAAVTAAAQEYGERIAPRFTYNPTTVSADLKSIVTYMEAEAQRAKANGQAAPLVVLDYLQLVSGEPHEDSASVIKRAVAELKQYAVKYNTVVFVIIAHNRAANNTGSVSADSGRDTSALEYSADTQLSLVYTATRKSLEALGLEQKIKPDDLFNKYADKSGEIRKHVTLVVTKGRWGGVGTDVDLYFDGETMTYKQKEYDFTPATIEPPKSFKRR